ncbi:hypothetical protein ACUNV4_24695 [Granulosicoccus sp. 3-233]|uniref:hypothetical protein n=1 Tax=Granulosicoccus sp. 3-233 TaxID=3417969 RepID=UPI003D3257AE
MKRHLSHPASLFRHCTLLGALVFCGVFSGNALSQEADPEWPCIQRLVMEVSPAVMWPLPVEEGMHEQWRENDELRQLAEELGDLASYTTVEQQQVEAFAASVPEAEKERQLSLLAVGVLDVTNGVRQQYIRGIKRYTRQQIEIAGQIEETLNRISLLDSGNGSDGAAQSLPPEHADLLATLKWHERVYDQREHAIRSLCDQPVELEETLSDVLRDIAQFLP